MRDSNVPYPCSVPPVRFIDQAGLCADLLNFPRSAMARQDPKWHKAVQKTVLTKQREHSGFSTGHFTREDATVPAADPEDTMAARMEQLSIEIGGRLTDNWRDEQRLELADFFRATDRLQPPPPSAQRPPVVPRVLVPGSSAPQPDAGVTGGQASAEQPRSPFSQRVPQESRHATDPDSSSAKTKAKNAPPKAVNGRAGSRAVSSSQHRDSSPDTETHTEDEIEDADGFTPIVRAPRGRHVDEGEMRVPQGRKRRRANDAESEKPSLPPFARPSSSR